MFDLDISVLRTFIAIVEEDTFARAAGRVHRTQAAVSQQMRRLEQQLDLTLFEKVGRNNELTRKGHELAEYARHILNQHDEMIRALKATVHTVPIKIGAAADVAESILPQVLRRFSDIAASHPLELHVGRSPYLLDALREGLIDIAVSTRWDQSLPSIVVKRSKVLWIAAHDYQLPRSGPLPLVLVDGPSIFRRIAVDALERQGRPWREQYTSNSYSGLRAIVRAGMGITARSAEILGPELRILGEAENLPDLGTINYYLYLNERSANQTARALFNDLSQAIGETPL